MNYTSKFRQKIIFHVQTRSVRYSDNILCNEIVFEMVKIKIYFKERSILR